jgi:hypothetical protein
MFRKIKTTDLPKRRRKVASKFEATQEWKLMKAALDAGLRPQEALEVVLTPADKKKYGLEHRRTVTRFIQKYVRSLGLPYSVKSFERELGTYFLVMHDKPVPAPVRKTG